LPLKGVAFFIVVCPLMSLSSNHRDALIITKEDRRIFVTESYEKPQDEAYFSNVLYPELKNVDFLSQVFWWLKDNLPSTFNPFMRAL
jgi:hypothetical protein